MKSSFSAWLIFSVFIFGLTAVQAEEPILQNKPCFSGIYPHLAYSNQEGECGTGAVVPWADRLWVITYGPHLPNGSSDKLYEIDSQLNTQIRPESIGGTPANRMIHSSSNQLFIGPYVIDKDRNIRVIPNKTMPGRLTGNARHLTQPDSKIYFATMEEGLYEVDVNDLSVKTLYVDSNRQTPEYFDILPGYHGKGLYSGQGMLYYANNGEDSRAARQFPTTPSGCLGAWDGKGTKAENWSIILRNQFTEITGPGGIYGNPNPQTDPIWSLGWDYRSVIVMLLDNNTWTKYRLPKASHCYDGAHGWNTEWPRIREINEDNNLLMTMHGMFWKFPKSFCSKNTQGIRPRSTYLKVIGDFCSWQGKVLLGCDDAAKSGFLNSSQLKPAVHSNGISNSNIWFINPSELDCFGPAFGRGAVWLNESVKAGVWSDPYLFSGFDIVSAFLCTDQNTTFDFEIDLTGNGTWTPLKSVRVNGAQWVDFTPDQKGEWIRVKINSDCTNVSCCFQSRNKDNRSTQADKKFDGLATAQSSRWLGGALWGLSDKLSLGLAAVQWENGVQSDAGYYELNESAQLIKAGDSAEEQKAGIEKISHEAPLTQIPASTYTLDDLSALILVNGKRYRLPIGNQAVAQISKNIPLRLDREVVTERDLFHCAGTFYELPADNAGAFPKIRPIATDGRLISDFCSYRGLLVLTGIDSLAVTQNNPHIIKSKDGKAAVWVGAIDDLWSLGKPGGQGWVWKQNSVKAHVPSDPFLMSGFDKKSMVLTNHSNKSITVTVEFEIEGTDLWKPYKTFTLNPKQTINYDFPEAADGYWIRTIPSSDGVMSASFLYQ